MIETKYKKFTFDVSFDEEDLEQERANAEPTYSQSDLDKARQKALATGKQQGIEEATTSLDARAVDFLQTISEQSVRLEKQFQQNIDQLRQDSLVLVTTAIKKILPRYASEHGFKEIEEVVEKALHISVEEPKLEILVAADMVDPLQKKIETAKNHAGNGSEIVVKADNSMGPGDCVVCWGKDGGVTHDTSALMAKIEKILDEALAPLFKDMPAKQDEAKDTETNKEEEETEKDETQQTVSIEDAPADEQDEQIDATEAETVSETETKAEQEAESASDSNKP